MSAEMLVDATKGGKVDGNDGVTQALKCQKR
jgi:hypothetical protein